MPEVKDRCEQCGALLTLDEKLLNRAEAVDEKKNSSAVWLCDRCRSSGGNDKIGCAIVAVIIIAILAHIFYGSYWFISHFKDLFASLGG